MNISNESILIIILLLVILVLIIKWLKNRPSFEFNIEDVPLCTEELERHAENLAKSQTVGKHKAGIVRVLKRLDKRYETIFTTHEKLTLDAASSFPIPPAAEWLLDNFYIIEEQRNAIIKELQDIRQPLPVILEGAYFGYPRVFSIAVEIISHVDGNANEKVTKDFIRAYQRYSFLSIEEVWMLPLMIKAALIEKLWIVCNKMQATRSDWYRAENLAKDIIKGNRDCDSIKDYFNSLEEVTPAFVEHLIKKLRKEGSKTLWVIECLDSILLQQSASSDNFISVDHYNQAATQVSIGNVINSLRALSSFDSTLMFEELNEVERILKQDPSGVYPRMDFNSRNHYRNVVVKLARQHRTTEINIARLSCEIAKESYDIDKELSPNNHIGYYIVGKGQSALFDRLGRSVNREIKNGNIDKEKSVKYYISAIICLTIIIVLIPLVHSITREVELSIFASICIGLLGLIPASEIAVTIINSFISHFVPPTRFPKLELKEGIPEELSTMVIVPTLVPNVARTLSLIDNLEVFYLANKCENLYFSLVGDFKDSDQKTLPEDNNIIDAALKRIGDLNKKYCSDNQPIFYFYCRERKFNENHDKWMGWERKRGAIIEFNRMLLGSTNTSYTYKSTSSMALPRIKYVITLDADTQLPLETAKQLIGTIAHPLNKAVFDVKSGIVTKGYGILQPRIDVNIESANVSPFTKVYAGQGGIDPYTTTVSDIYQDAFGEGIFTGKGIYDLHIFQRALDNSIPENTVLSHDLLEGSYLRAGLVTDIELIDGYPGKYNSFMMRLHRWTRGDWQLLPWIFGENSLSVLSKWKMLDNLRRSLVCPVSVILFLISLTVLRSSSIAWIWLLGLSVCTPVICYLVHILLMGNYRLYVSKRSATVIVGFKAIAMQLGLVLSFLPYQAALMTNAIIKTIYRVLVTRKNLLEWVTAADMELALKNDLVSYYRRMWFAPVFGAISLLLCSNYNSKYIWLVLVLFIVWFISPWLAYEISKPANGTKIALNEEDINELRLLTRKTWCYFDEFAGEEDNYLPADNFQEEPYKGAAHRTSPTNIGLLLVSDLAARDMGYLSSIELFEKIARTIDTIDKMEKWNGHLYNWYNTTNIQVLRPRFVSTVDSGNFAGYLMVLNEGLSELRNKPIYDESFINGLIDMLQLCNTEIDVKKPYFNIEILKELSSAESIAESFKKLIPALTKFLDRLEANYKNGYWIRKLNNSIDKYEAAYKTYGIKLFEKLCEINEIDISILNLQNRIQDIIDNMHFKSLFDEGSNLFTIGFNVEEGHASKSHYDLFASEARQTSLIAIAKGEVGKQHWFRLGRKLVKVSGNKGLVSWTGTMFEYLMPRLLIKSYPNTLIEKTYEFVVRTQISYGRSKNAPWGISESCYYAFDILLNYQYRAFGVPQLGLKRGLADDCVIAPYATVMAVGITPNECMENIRSLRDIGAEGKFGLYEAIDYSSSRMNENQRFAIVKSYMVHHQGMSMLALVNFFKENIMQTRFHRNPEIKSVDSLLQEKFPYNVVISKEYREQPSFEKRKQANTDEIVLREYLETSIYPKMHLLSNGSYYVMLTDRGSGYGKYGSTAVYRWINDYMQSSGAFIYLRNINSNEYWSTTYSPTNRIPEAYKVIFSPHKAEYVRREGSIETNTEVLVSSEDNTEVRRISIHNHSNSRRVLELTSYMEVVLTEPEADIAHPAFSKLFVKTEYVEHYHGLLAVRRKRDDIKQTVWGYHVVSTEGTVQGQIEYETDRYKFIGRNRGLSAPKAMEPDQPLSNSIGSVLDPVFSLRIRVSLEAGQSTTVNFCMGICDSRKAAIDMLEKYHDPAAVDRVIEMAWTRSIVEAGFINATAKEEKDYLRLLPRLVYGINRFDHSKYIQNNTLGQSNLWSFGISGDLPIVLVTIESRDSFEEIGWVLKLHDYYRFKGVIFDLVILISDEESYFQPLLDMIRDMAASGHARELMDKRGGVFIRNSKQMDEQHKNLLFACAKIILDADKGIADLMERIEASERLINDVALLAPNKSNVKSVVVDSLIDEIEDEELQFFNGYGGFTQDGNEYVIHLKPKESTPAPWVNIIANNKFGFICTESGAGYTWHQNSSQNKLTAWANDPVIDTPSEIIYIHDVKDGSVWSITPSPIRENGYYTIRHGFGYTTFRHKSHGVEQELTQFAAADYSVKISIISLKNNTKDIKDLDLGYFTRPVMGTEFNQTSPYIVTSFDSELNTLFIDNVYSTDFRGLTAYLACSENETTYSGHRLEFLGPDMDLAMPMGMRIKLNGTVGAGLDSCAASKTRVKINPGETKQVAFLFGQDRLEDAKNLIKKFSDINIAQQELNTVRESWARRLKQIQVSTPNSSMNILLNGWLQYQVLSSRIFARTGFYQAGGAFGYRDQLQDVMSVVYTLPEITRNQILIHCRHQFVEGDVQHWWHDQKTNGIRTRYSDDLLWLPYVTCDYINTTGDYDVLKAEEGYLQSSVLNDNEHERYETPNNADLRESVYQHCIRAIDKGLRFGAHGIPLMGGGDWNDGMNLVGAHGKGESVWLGWFMYCVLKRMTPICRRMGDEEKAKEYEEYADNIIAAIEKEAWDGSWYRRAYFDDGTPLGSIQNEEGKIDSLSQSWAAISGAAKASRVEEGMSAITNYLIDKQNGIIKLLTPPFYDADLNPGYIKGYLPGVRENGGQYTHAATWVIYAFSKLGNGEQAWELFDMINPINHSRTNMECMTYKVEPYVMAADVYAVYPNEGRGGWTWYTGAAGWMYRIGLEHILGIKKKGNYLVIQPCIPKNVGEYSVKYIHGSSTYEILINNQSHQNTTVKQLIIDDKAVNTNKFELIDDGKIHKVEALM